MKRKNKGLAGFYTENKALVWAGGFGFGLAIIYGIYRVTSKGGAASVGKFANASMNNTSTQTQQVIYVDRPTTSTSTGAGASISSANFPLKVGSNNEAVKRFQAALNTIFGSGSLVADGAFGPKTETFWRANVSPLMPVDEDYYNAVITASQQMLGFRKRKLKETFRNVNDAGDVKQTFNEQNPIKLGF